LGGRLAPHQLEFLLITPVQLSWTNPRRGLLPLTISSKSIDMIESNISSINISELKQYKECIINYYQLEIENKRRMVSIEFYQFLLFIVHIIIIALCWLFYK
jgi:hypothetical protein